MIIMLIEGCAFDEDMILKHTKYEFFATYKETNIAVQSAIHGLSIEEYNNLFRIEVFNTEEILVDTWVEFDTIREAIAYALIESGLTTKKISMKSILEWLEEAKEQGYEWADAAIKNYNYDSDKTTYPHQLDNPKSLAEALRGAFDWEKSPEGHKYWKKIHYGLENVSEVPKTLSDLVKLYEGAKFNAKNIAPNFELREPYRQTAFEATKASYEAESEELAQQIAEMLGFWDKYEALQKEFEAHKATAEELNRSYISEHNENYERMMKIEQLEKEIEFLKNRKPIGWIAADADEAIYRHGDIEKGDEHWMLFSKELTSKEAIALCGRVPEWSDEEPTPIYK